MRACEAGSSSLSASGARAPPAGPVHGSRKSGMSGPGGTTTRRDQRRDTRRAQFQQRQLERQRERQRQLQRQRYQRIGIGVAGFVALALVAFLIIHAVVGAASPGANIVTGKGTFT